MTPISSMVAQMLQAGVPNEAIVLAVQTAEECLLVRRISADVSVDITAERRRERDRERKRLARVSADCPQISAESADCPNHASISSSLIKENLQTEKKERGRGSRLSADWTPASADIEFAELRGLRGGDIEIEVMKFLNHWTSKPGKDATKLDWSKTWQNWILRDWNSNVGRAEKASGGGVLGAIRAINTGLESENDREGDRGPVQRISKS